MRVNWNLPLVLLKVKTITLFVICLAYAGELSAASFDCSKASNKVERTICSVASISALDEKLAVAYKKAGSSYKQSQRDWLKKRNKCGADANCLFIEYTARIKFLTTASSNPPTPTKRLVTSNLADCSPNVFHNCYGTYNWDTGEKYVGEWQNRMRVGEGIFTYRNGDEYTGSWKGNVPHGNGKLATSVGTIYVGIWIDGTYQNPKVSQKSQLVEEGKSKITSRPTSLLLKCVDKHGFYFINHAEDNSTADFLYVKSGDRFSRAEFYNVFNTRLVVRDLVYIYPNFKFNVPRSYNYRKWSTTIQRDTGVLRASHESRNPLYKPGVSGSREFYRYNGSYNCNVSSDHEIFFTLKEEYLSYLNTEEKEKSEKLIEDKNNRLKNKKF